VRRLRVRRGEQQGHGVSSVLATVLDDLTLVLLFAFAAGGIGAVLLAWRSRAAEEASPGELFSLLLFSVLGMAILVAATNLVTLFLGFELLSTPCTSCARPSCAASARSSRASST
jgi:NADH:ubiquinone oxidoreductase subunit 2 (subunit N)